MTVISPSGTKAEIEVKKRKVVPEFSTLSFPGLDNLEGGINSSEDSRLLISDPNLKHESREAFVSRERRGLTIIVGELDNKERQRARCV